MKTCQAEMDFEGALAFKNPLIYTQEKLRILKCLQNPNHDKIAHLTRRIIQLEKMDFEKHFKTSFFNEQTLERLIQHQKRTTLKRIENCKRELDALKSQKPKRWIENDIVITLLDELDKGHHNRLEFELIVDKIFLELRSSNGLFI